MVIGIIHINIGKHTVPDFKVVTNTTNAHRNVSQIKKKTIDKLKQFSLIYKVGKCVIPIV